MDDSRPQRRKSLKNLLFGELGVGRRFESVQRNFLLWKSSSKVSMRCSSFRGDGDIIRSEMESVTESWGACSEKTSSQGSCLRKSWKGSFSRSLSWIKWNFLSSSSLRNHHASCPAPLENSCSFSSIPKHEVSNILCPEIEPPPVETEQRRENFDGIKMKANEGKDCDLEDENEVKDCDDVSKKEGLSSDCQGRFCEEEEEECGGGNDVEEQCDTEDECDIEEGHGHKGSLRKKLVRRYPPPLPSLARTGNLPCHMPWVHLRSYKTDGRLVIKEVKVRHHEFFRAHRSNGRLTLHLVQHDENKVRAYQAGLFKAEAEEAAIDPAKEDIDEPEESKEMGIEEERGEAENVHNEGTNRGKALEGPEKRNGDTDGEDEAKRIGGKVEKLNCDEGQDELLPCFRSFARERLIPDSLQMQTQRFSGSLSQANSSAVGYGGKGLDSPVGCCSPISNPFFDRPISAIRPIRS